MNKILFVLCSVVLSAIMVMPISAQDGAPPPPGSLTMAAAVCENGTNGPDYWTGTGGDDCYNGLDGGDTILGQSGKDDLGGGKNQDYIEGNGYQDVIHGGHGADTIHGGNGDDFLYAGCEGGCDQTGEGVDRIYGNEGNDTIGVNNGKKDIVDCGIGAFDKVYIDTFDEFYNCETIR